MNLIRSIVFNGLFYGWTSLCCLAFLPLLILPRSNLFRASKVWSHGVLWICDKILGLKVDIAGWEKLNDRPVIFAVKHQSAWETIVFQCLISNPAIVLKKELTWIPLFGWYLKKLQMVPISRSKRHRVQDLKNLLKAAQLAIEKNRSIIIFPEGTRSHPGQKGTYHSGISSLYNHLKIPVIPIAHNAGLFWPRRGFIKYSGVINLEFLDIIQPGLSRQDFMHTLEKRIETTTNTLVEKGLTHVA